MLTSIVGLPLDIHRDLDTSDMWLELEGRGAHQRRSLVDSVRWATGERKEAQWHNAGNDAHMVMDLVKEMTRYTDVVSARWGILGAYTLAQIPSERAMRDQLTNRHTILADSLVNEASVS